MFLENLKLEILFKGTTVTFLKKFGPLIDANHTDFWHYIVIALLGVKFSVDEIWKKIKVLFESENNSFAVL